ncbi:hypothetical protein BGZ70_007414, partial [Mortierella alpina]
MSGEGGLKDMLRNRNMAATDYLTYKSPSFSTSRDFLLQQRFDPDYVRPRSSNDHHNTSRADQGFAGELNSAGASSVGTGAGVCVAWVDSPEAELEEVCTKTAFDEGEMLIESPQIPCRQIK